jgi:hypothetical protein
MGRYALVLAFAQNRKVLVVSCTNVDPQSSWLKIFLLDAASKPMAQ